MRVWVASLLFYFTIYILCEISRFLVQKLISRRHPKYAELLHEFIGTIQICAPMFDVNFVLNNYGLKGVLLEITFIEIVNSFLLRDAIADPCPLLFGFIKNTISAKKVGTILGIQFIAGYVSYLIARQFWSMGIHPQHLEILNEECGTDLTVTVIYGSLVEATGCFTAKAAEVFLENRIVNKKQLMVIQAFVAGVITILGIHLTGMYANPIVAWACTFNCGNVPYLAHFMVYWIAPLLAWHVADMVFTSESHEKKD